LTRKNKSTRKQETDVGLLEEKYLEIVPLANRFGDEIKHQLELLIQEKGVILGLPIQRRTKSWSSIQEKIERKSLCIANLQDLNDLVGLRIIVQFLKDLAIVRDIVRSHLTLIEEDDTEGRLREDQFGYNSIHFIVELPEAWLAVPTLSSLKGLKAEIQLRTTAQHIWAAASHTLQYKQEASVPVPIRRAIHRVSALLETVDLEFDRVLQERADYRASISDNSEDKNLNVDLIEEILDSVFPASHKKPPEPYGDLMRELECVGVTSSRMLEKLLNKYRDSVISKDAQIVGLLRSSSEPENEKYGFDSDRTARGVFYSHIGLARAALEEEFGHRWHFRRKKVKKPPNE